MEVPAVQENEQPIAVNLTIDRTEAFEDVDTRASVKTNWAEGDVVFVFFYGIAPPKYLEMKFTEGKWVATPMNGLTASDLSNATEKRMSANYLPYGSYATLQADGDAFLLDQPYNGVFYYAKPTSYTYDSELHGTLNLKVYEPSAYQYVHYDVSGYTDRHAYALYQDHVKSLTISQLRYGGNAAAVDANLPLAGHIDKERGVLTFSGIVDNSVIGKETDYQFSINDETASVLYTRDAGNHTLSKSTAVGLGDLSGSKWLATEYVYLGINLTLYQKLCWAKKNVGATAVQGEGSYGKYYAHMKTTGYAPSGTFGNYTMSHTFNEEDYNAGMTKLNTEITSGDIPDILCISDVESFDNYSKKGLMADINTFIENDPDYNRDDYCDAILRKMENGEGKLYLYPTNYYLVGFAAKKKYIPNDGVVSMDEIMKFKDQGMKFIGEDADRIRFWRRGQ